MMSPAEIEIALHFFYSPAEYPKPSPVSLRTEQALLDAGMIEAAPAEDRGPGMSPYRATEGLRLYVEALGAVPWPAKVWRMPGETP